MTISIYNNILIYTCASINTSTSRPYLLYQKQQSFLPLHYDGLINIAHKTNMYTSTVQVKTFPLLLKGIMIPKNLLNGLHYLTFKKEEYNKIKSNKIG
jgi:hypothetical protein